ncbi:MAG: lysylphosphatidylglycerol synthase transmembrane domain-containing protein [Planctomycetota bacterium]|nr:lysylphosphatidylglycerol synthase transmembrane domain-containing protein [Planctomycetota bacterium]
MRQVQSPPPREDASPTRGFGARLALGVFIGLLVYAVLAAWADVDGLRAALEQIPLWAPAAACALSLANYLVRFPRWQRYLRLIGSDVRGADSLRIYLAGLSLTVSPGKVGEALKSWLLREVDGTPLSRSAPIVLAERVTDLFGFIVLIAVTAGTSEHLGIALFTALLAAGVVLLVATRRGAGVALALAGWLPGLRSRTGELAATLDSARALLRPGELPLAVLLATLGWGLECVGCWIIVTAALPESAVATPALGLVDVTYAFALAAVAGAVFVISPGGLGVTEGLLTGLLSRGYAAAGLAVGAARATALSATLVTRLCTLWFAMGIGLVALALHRRSRPSGGAPEAR